MAYDRVITACDRAATAVATTPAGWRAVFHDETVRAQSILIELMSVLQTEHADADVAEMSRQLAALYRFTIDQLVRANVEKKAKHLGPARSTIEGLRDAWVVGVLGQ